MQIRERPVASTQMRPAFFDVALAVAAVMAGLAAEAFDARGTQGVGLGNGVVAALSGVAGLDAEGRPLARLLDPPARRLAEPVAAGFEAHLRGGAAEGGPGAHHVVDAQKAGLGMGRVAVGPAV